METQVQRDFTQKLINNVTSSPKLSGGSTSFNTNTAQTISDNSSIRVDTPIIVEPVDYENYYYQNHTRNGGQLVEFPEGSNDVDVYLLPRKVRTFVPSSPEEDISNLVPHVREFVQSYTRDWLVVNYVNRHIKTIEDDKSSLLAYEDSWIPSARSSTNSTHTNSKLNHQSKDFTKLNYKHSNLSENTLTSNINTNSATDSKNYSNDPLIETVLQRLPIETLDRLNSVARLDNRKNCLFSKCNDYQIKPPVPCENVPSHRILVKCSQLESFESNTELLFAHMSLYDVRLRKKMSENFDFDFNSCSKDGNKIDTRSQTCIFNIDGTGDDLFLVIRIEKPLRSDSDSAFIAIDGVSSNVQKTEVNSNSYATQHSYVKYRMAYAWTAIYIADVISSGSSENLDCNSTGSKSNSLGRSNTIIIHDHESLERKSSYSMKNRNNSIDKYNWSEKYSINSFRPVTITINEFYKQETDKLKDDDLYKLLQEIKTSNCSSKKLKNVNGFLKLDISPSSNDNVKLTSASINNVTSEDKCLPVKDVLEFPLANYRLSSPHYVYRNLLYVYPKELNFAGRTGSARNIAIKIQLMYGERQPADSGFAIFEKSPSLNYVSEAYSTVSYHQKCPTFYDEFKIKLPADLNEKHHLLFTFYHISCRRRGTQDNFQQKFQFAPDSIIGYTWLPLLKDKILNSGEICLPVALQFPPPENYSYITPDVALPGIEWIDNHKQLFTVVLQPISSIYPKDIHLNNFFNYCSVLECDPLPRRIAESNIEAEIKHRISNLVRCQIDHLIEFLPVVLDKLISLLVQTPKNQPMNLGQIIFRTLSDLVSITMNHSQGQKILSSYVFYQSCSNIFDLGTLRYNIRENGSNHELENLDYYFRVKSNSDSSINSCSSPLLDGNTFSIIENLRSPSKLKKTQNSISSHDLTKSIHEKLALQWVVATSIVRQDAASNSRFFFDVIVKSMAITLTIIPGGLYGNRKNKFSSKFLDNISTLCENLSLDIVSNYQKDSKVNIINCNLAWFLHNLLSLADRGFIFSLINKYVKTIFSKQQIFTDLEYEHYSMLTSLKLDFLKIICRHEHYVPLNLISKDFHNISPTLSLTSTISNQSLITENITSATEIIVKEFSELSLGFRHNHYLVGLVLSEFVTILKCSKNNSKVKEKVVDILIDLMSSHDTRYQHDKWSRHKALAQISLMYLPLLTIVTTDLLFIDILKLEFDTDKNKLDNDNYNSFNMNSINTISDKLKLNEITSNKVLAGILWILKNLDNDIKFVWLSNSTSQRAQNTLSILTLCIERFYNNSNNKKDNQKCANCNNSPKSYNGNFSQSSINKKDNTLTTLVNSNDVKSKLEDIILGQGSARSQLMRLKAGFKSPNGNNSTSKMRWRKNDVFTYNRPSTLESCTCIDQQLEKIFGTYDQSEAELDVVNEIGFILLDTIEQIIQVASSTTNTKSSNSNHWSIHRVFKLLVLAMSINDKQYNLFNLKSTTSALECMFSTQRSMVAKFPELLFRTNQTERDLYINGKDHNNISINNSNSSNCENFILMLLRHCALKSSTLEIRMQSTASLYSLMRQNFYIENNFARIKIKVTVALSILIGGTQFESKTEVLSFNIEYLKQMLKTILLYAEHDSSELQNTTFPDQVKDLVLNLNTIISDTVQMKKYNQDPEMLLDLMYHIAKGYQQTSLPNLRLTWLEYMSQKHIQRNNFTEAGMCLIHGAALVMEYLTTTRNHDLMDFRGADCLEFLSPNILEECFVSDDVIILNQTTEQVCLDEKFTEIELVSLLDRAAELFLKAGMFEVMSQLYNRVIIQLIEKTNNYKKLSDTYLKMHEAYSKLERLHGRRVFGTYFRVGFYGSKFFGPDGLDGVEFVYKEPTLTKLSEIFGRLQNFYSERFGEQCITIIKDSNTVDPNVLDPQKAYIQITYVEPYFDAYERRTRVTHFQKNFNLKRFVFFTPFTPDGRPHGQLNQQYKRKTILTVAHHFPYLKTRIRVQSRQIVVLEPIEVALEDLKNKTDELAHSVRQDPADPKMLQMVLQGCIGTTVNRGPMEMALVFLGSSQNNKYSIDGSSEFQHPVLKPPLSRLQNKLRLCFKDFLKKCSDALEKNETLIGPDQWNYQRELERNYQQLTDQLTPMLIANSSSSVPVGCSNSLNKPENYGLYHNCHCNTSTINTYNNESYKHTINCSNAITSDSDALQ